MAAEAKGRAIRIMSAYGFEFAGENTEGLLTFDFGGHFTTFTGWDELSAYINYFIIM